MANGIITAPQISSYTFEGIWSVVSKMDKADKIKLTRRLISEYNHAKEAKFPRIANDWKPNPIVYKMVENRNDVELDIRKETEMMWEEYAK